jgi:DNA excision repair protein ERCC-1
MEQTKSSSSKGKERQPPVVQPSSGNAIIVNPCQRLNPVVECIRNVPKVFGDILPDYQVGRTTGVLFLRFLPLPCRPTRDGLLSICLGMYPSLRYHRLHPEYIHQRIERLGQSYNLRILLLMCDIVRTFHLPPTRTPCPTMPPVRTPRPNSRAHKGLPAQQHHCHRSLVVSHTPFSTLSHTYPPTYSADEAGQYLTAYKQSEHRPPTLIRERVDKTPSALLRAALTSIPRVNKTDVETLRSSFGVRWFSPMMMTD